MTTLYCVQEIWPAPFWKSVFEPLMRRTLKVAVHPATDGAIALGVLAWVSNMVVKRRFETWRNLWFNIRLRLPLSESTGNQFNGGNRRNDPPRGATGAGSRASRNVPDQNFTRFPGVFGGQGFRLGNENRNAN